MGSRARAKRCAAVWSRSNLIDLWSDWLTGHRLHATNKSLDSLHLAVESGATSLGVLYWQAGG